jgi:hypothetical protein
MASCAECSTDISGVSHFVCAYCGAAVCPDHHLPESHDCDNQAAATAPTPTRKHVELGIHSSTTRATPPATREDRQPSPAETIRPEAYPARRYTDPVPGDDQAPAGKRHREWTPDSKSPDLRPDGSLAGDAETQPASATAGLNYARIAGLTIAVVLVFLILYIF